MSDEKPILTISNLHVGIEGTPILKGIDISIPSGEIHAIMGRNGSGKTTAANVIMGHPSYDIEEGDVLLSGESILDMEPWERSRSGVFLSFQYPQSVPGLQVGNFLRKSVSSVRGDEAAKGSAFREDLKNAMSKLNIPSSFLSRYVNDGFSGGEKKRFEILQMMLLKPRLAVLDETDSGLDIDALRIVSQGVNAMRDAGRSFLVITHYQRLLDHIVPDFVHVLSEGQIVKSGPKELALELEEKGYDWIKEPAV